MKKTIILMILISAVVPFAALSQKQTSLTIQGNAIILPVEPGVTLLYTVHPGDLLATDKITPDDAAYKVDSWSFVHSEEGGTSVIRSKDNTISQEIREAFRKIKPGEKFWIETVLSSGSGGEKKIGSIAVLVVE